MCGNLLNLSKYGHFTELEYCPIVQKPPHVNSLNLFTTLGVHPVSVEALTLIISSDLCSSVISNHPAPLWKK